MWKLTLRQDKALPCERARNVVNCYTNPNYYYYDSKMFNNRIYGQTTRATNCTPAQCLQQPKVHLTDDRLNERFAQLANATNAVGLLWLLLLQSAAINTPEGSLLDELLAAYRARLDGAPTKLVLGVDGSHAIAAVAGAGRSAVRQHGSGRIGAITARRRQTVHLQCWNRER